jgi:hypothetical protein
MHPRTPSHTTILSPAGLRGGCRLYAFDDRIHLVHAGPADAWSRATRGAWHIATRGEDVRAGEIVSGELTTCDPDGLMFVTVDTPHDDERAKVLVSHAATTRAARGNRITDGSR